jgi:hypothetical protein
VIYKLEFKNKFKEHKFHKAYSDINLEAINTDRRWYGIHKIYGNLTMINMF